MNWRGVKLTPDVEKIEMAKIKHSGYTIEKCSECPLRNERYSGISLEVRCSENGMVLNPFFEGIPLRCPKLKR